MLEEMAAAGAPPPALLNRPLLDSRLTFFYLTYLEVNRSRQFSSGGSPYPLQIRPFLDYCELHRVDMPDRAWLWDGVCTFDDQWSTIARRKLAADMAQAKAKK